MKFPRGQNESGQQVSIYYLTQRDLYVCAIDRFSKYSKDDTIHLVPLDSVKRALRIIDESRKEFLAFAQCEGYENLQKDHEDLSIMIKEEIGLILSKLETAGRKKKNYKFKLLLEDSLKIEETLKSDKLFINFAVTKAGEKAQRIDKGDIKNTVKLSTRELREKYGAKLKKVVDKFEKQRKRVQKRNAKEALRLTNKLQKKSEKIKQLKFDLRDQKNSFHQDKKDLQDRFEREIENKTETINQLKQNILQFPVKYDTLFEEVKNEGLKNEAIIEDFRKENTLLREKNMSHTPISKTNFNILYKSIKKEKIKVGPEYELFLDLSKEKDKKFIGGIKSPIPNVNSISLQSIPRNNKGVKDFIKCYFPRQFNLLGFNYNTSLRNYLDDYVDEIILVRHQVKEGLNISNFEVSQENLVKILSNYKHAQGVRFLNCELSLYSIPDFGDTLVGSKLQELNLDGGGDRFYSDWGNNPGHFENLINGLSRSNDFKNSLERIYVNSGGMEWGKVREILDSYGLDKTKIEIHTV